MHTKSMFLVLKKLLNPDLGPMFFTGHSKHIEAQKALFYGATYFCHKSKKYKSSSLAVLFKFISHARDTQTQKVRLFQMSGS